MFIAYSIILGSIPTWGQESITIQLNYASPTLLQSYENTLMISATNSHGTSPDGDDIFFDTNTRAFSIPIKFEWSVEPESPGTGFIISNDTSSAILQLGSAGVYNVFVWTNGTDVVADEANQTSRFWTYLQVGFVGVHDDLSCRTSSGGAGSYSADDAMRAIAFTAEAFSKSPEVISALAASNWAVPRDQALLRTLDEEYRLGSRDIVLGGVSSRYLADYQSRNELIASVVVTDGDGIAVAANPYPQYLYFGDKDVITKLNGTAYVSPISFDPEDRGSLFLEVSERVVIGGEPAYIILHINMTLIASVARWLPEYGRLGRPINNLPIHLIRTASSWHPVMRRLAPLLGDWIGGTRVARAFTVNVKHEEAAARGYGRIELAAEQMAVEKARSFLFETRRQRWWTLSGTEGPERMTPSSFYLEPGCSGSYTGFCLIEEVSLGMSPEQLAEASTAHHTLGWLVKQRTGEHMSEENAVLQPDRQCPECGFGVVWHVQTPVAVELGSTGYVLRDASLESFKALDRRVGESIFSSYYDDGTRRRTAHASDRDDANPAEETDEEADARILMGPGVDRPTIDYVIPQPRSVLGMSFGEAVARHREAVVAQTQVTSLLPTPDAAYVLPIALYNLSKMQLRLLHCPKPLNIYMQMVEDMRVPSLFVNPGFEVHDTRSTNPHSTFVPMECLGSACIYGVITPAAAVVSFGGRDLIKEGTRARVSRDAVGSGFSEQGMSQVRVSHRKNAFVGDGYTGTVEDGGDSIQGTNQSKRASASNKNTKSPSYTMETDDGFVSRAAESYYRHTDEIIINAPELVTPPSASGFVHDMMIRLPSYLSAFMEMVRNVKARNERVSAMNQSDLDAEVAQLTKFRRALLTPTVVTGFLRSINEYEHVYEAVAMYDRGGIMLGSHPVLNKLPVYLDKPLRLIVSGGITVIRAAKQFVATLPDGSIESVIRLVIVIRVDELPVGKRYSVLNEALDHVYAWYAVEYKTTVVERHTFVNPDGLLRSFVPGTPLKLGVGLYDFAHEFTLGDKYAVRGRHEFRIGVVDCGSGTLNRDGTCTASELSLQVTLYLVGVIVVVSILGLVALVLRMYVRYRAQRAKYDALPRPRETHDVRSDDDDDDPDAVAEKRKRKEVKMHPGVVVPGHGVTAHACYAMFTDIEASTQLWQQYASLMEEAVAEHHRVIRARCARNNGVEVNSQGDSFFFVFHSAGECVETCVMIQLDLLNAKWRSRLLRVPLLMLSHEVDADVSTEGGKRETARLSSVSRGRKPGTLGSDSPGHGPASDAQSGTPPQSMSNTGRSLPNAVNAVVEANKRGVSKDMVHAEGFAGNDAPNSGSGSFASGVGSAPRPPPSLPESAPLVAPHPTAEVRNSSGLSYNNTTDSAIDWPRGGLPRQQMGVPPGQLVSSASSLPTTVPAVRNSGGTPLTPPVKTLGSAYGDEKSSAAHARNDARQRVHTGLGRAAIHSKLASGEQTLEDYTTPTISWRGLRVRCGASPLSNARLHLFGLQSFREYLGSCGATHKGSALAFDYVGPDVNRAARVAGAARGGEVVMPMTMLDQLPQDMIMQLSVVAMGGVFLKGIGNSGELVSILPKGLGRTFTTQASATHCDKCYGVLACLACEQDEGRLGEWMGAVE